MVNIQLIQGDCLKVMPTLAQGSIDLVLADPPYGTTACKWDSVIPLGPMWECLKRLTKERAAIVMTASQPFTSQLVMSNPKWFRHEWIWEKDNGSSPGLAKFQPVKYHENITVFSKKTLEYIPQMVDVGKPSNSRGRNSIRSSGFRVMGYLPQEFTNFRYPKSIQKFNRPKHNSGGSLHPTQKPVALMEYLIKTYTHSGDTVLDFTMGSGTTGVAAKKLGRNFIGIELDAEYFSIAKNRIDDTWAPGQNAPAVQRIKGDKEQLDIWDALAV